MKPNYLVSKKNLFLLLILFIFSFSFVHAGELDEIFLDTFKQNQCVNLLQTCDNCSYVNLTFVQYPNSNYSLLGEYSMTKNGTTYTYNYCQTSELGDYKYGTKGDLDGIITTQPIRFTITTTGNSKINTIPIYLLIGGYILLVLGVYKREYIIGFSSGTLLIFGGVYLLIYGLGLFNNLYTQSLAYISLFLGLIISFVSAYEAFPNARGEVFEDD